MISGVKNNIELRRQKTKLFYDKRAKPLPNLDVGEPVLLQPQRAME